MYVKGEYKCVKGECMYVKGECMCVREPEWIMTCTAPHNSPPPTLTCSSKDLGRKS